MKIKFNEYIDEQRFLGLKRLNLQSWKNDPTKTHDCLAYDIFRAMGIVAPRCSYADVYVNDESLGLFGLVEQIDGRFTDSRFEEGDGNLYKEAWPVSADGDYFDERLRTNQDTADHDHDDFVSFAEALNGDMAARFRTECIKHWRSALRQRSHKSTITWERMNRIAKRWLPPARVCHPWPDKRFDVRTQGRSPVR